MTELSPHTEFCMDHMMTVIVWYEKLFADQVRVLLLSDDSLWRHSLFQTKMSATNIVDDIVRPILLVLILVSMFSDERQNWGGWKVEVYQTLIFLFWGDFHNFFVIFESINPIRPGGGGAQRPGWPNSQLPIRNLLFYHALNVLTKFYRSWSIKGGGGGGGCCCSFLIKASQKFTKWKIFLCLEIAEIDMGVNFGSRRTILNIKTLFFKLNPFSGG